MAFEIGGGPGDSGQGGGEFKRRAFARKDATELAFGPGEKPHDTETERAVLAGVFLSNDCFPEMQQSLKADDFFLPAHRETYSAMLALSMQGVPIDVTTVAGYLRDRGKLDTIVGGAAYLAQIFATPSSSLHAVEYAKHVADLAWRRRMLDAAEQCRSAALKVGDTREIASEIEKRIFDTTQQRKNVAMRSLQELVGPAIQEFEKRTENQGLTDEYAMTGLKDLDEALSGLRPGQLIVVAAGPGTGKTSLATNMMIHITTKQRMNVLFFSLEMRGQEIAERILSSVASIDASKLRNGKLSPQDFNELYYAADELEKAPLFIDDRSMVTPFDILAQARQLKTNLMLQGKDPKIGLIVVDYIQIMKAGVRAENRSLEVAAITGGLKAIAKEMEVPVMALSQLNREGFKRNKVESGRPQLSDLRDSGAIEADADVVMFIHRDQTPGQDSRAPAPAEIIIAKQRSGPTKDVPVTWLGHLTRYVDAIQPQMMPDEYQMPSGMDGLPAFDPSAGPNF